MTRHPSGLRESASSGDGEAGDVALAPTVLPRSFARGADLGCLCVCLPLWWSLCSLWLLCAGKSCSTLSFEEKIIEDRTRPVCNKNKIAKLCLDTH